MDGCGDAGPRVAGGSLQVPYAVSANGDVVAGNWVDSAGNDRAFRWTSATGPQDLGTLGGATAVLGGAADFRSSLSADGGTIVGSSLDAQGRRRAFRWTPAGGMQDLGTLGGAEAQAHAVSANGTVVVGWALTAAGETRAFRWSVAGGMQNLGTLLSLGSYATHVSSDGCVVAGTTYAPNQVTQTFRWTSALGAVLLTSVLPGASSDVRGMSSDGTVIVGNGMNGGFRFGPGGLAWLASYWGAFTVVEGVSDDGGAVFGFIVESSGNHPFRWSTPSSFFLLDAYVPGNSIGVTAMAGDGNTLVGYARNTLGFSQAFRWTSGVLGTVVCTGFPNSTSCWATIAADGSSNVAQNNVVLTARGVPANSLGIFLVSRTPGSSPANGSSGRLCLGGAIGRFTGPGQVLNSGAQATLSLAIDLTALPTPTGFVAAQPGESWYFQAWHRDVTSSQTPTSNFTDTIRVTLQ